MGRSLTFSDKRSSKWPCVIPSVRGKDVTAYYKSEATPRGDERVKNDIRRSWICVMKPKNQARASVITLQAHPPERRRRPSTELLSQLNGCCCCCCCCCLHSLGSLVGAAWGSASASRWSAADLNQSQIKFPDDEIDGRVQEPRPFRIPVNRIYWGSVVCCFESRRSLRDVTWSAQ